jgi:hypothetical protein
MTTIIREIIIEADATNVWDALRDFGALQEKLAPGFVTGCRLETSDTRVVTFFNGAEAHERLVGVDEDARRLAYTVIESGFDATHHNAGAQVIDDGAGRSRFAWTVDVLPDELATPMGEMMEAGLDAIREHLDRRGIERQAPEARGDVAV